MSTISLARAATAATLALSGPLAFSQVSNSIVADYGTVSLPFTQGFSNQFGSLTSVTPVVVNGTAYNFYDDYTFTMPGVEGTLSASLVSISLGTLLNIDTLQARIYDASSGLSIGLPGTGVPVQAWSQAFTAGGISGTAVVFDGALTLNAGTTYTLEVRGLVTGTAGGSYGGNLNISAVPEPETYALFALGLLGIGLTARGRIQGRQS